MSKLDEIVAETKAQLEIAKRRVPLSALQETVANLSPRSKHLKKTSSVQIIAEIKPKSPSAGQLLSGDPLTLAKTYEQHQANALSVLTNQKFFGGSLSLLSQIRQLTSLPILRKDFIIDPYQVYQTKVYQADLILLIYQICSDNFQELLDLSLKLGLQPLIEVYDANEIQALQPILDNPNYANQIILGINNRNLKTFEVNYKHSLELASFLPTEVLKASLSGIQTVTQAQELWHNGFEILLIGQTAMQNPSLLSEIHQACQSQKDN